MDVDTGGGWWCNDDVIAAVWRNADVTAKLTELVWASNDSRRRRTREICRVEHCNSAHRLHIALIMTTVRTIHTTDLSLVKYNVQFIMMSSFK